MNTNSETQRRANGLALGECQVVSRKLELPQGSFFVVLRGVPVRRGDLVYFSIGRRSSVGRWYPDVGVQWMLQPKLRILCDGTCPLRIHGRVIPVDLPIKQITNLPTSEYEQFFHNPFPRSLDS
jgi:hypothetical protein